MPSLTTRLAPITRPLTLLCCVIAFNAYPAAFGEAETGTTLTTEQQEQLSQIISTSCSSGVGGQIRDRFSDENINKYCQCVGNGFVSTMSVEEMMQLSQQSENDTFQDAKFQAVTNECIQQHLIKK